MQKKIIALAVAALASGAAFAQSNVTIYGSIDMGASFRSESVYSNVGDQFAIDSGISAGNRLGFKGTEDLGNGLKALFTLEAGYAADVGTSSQGGRLFGRQAFVGLTGGFGTAIAGRLYTPHYSFLSALDPFKAGTVGQYRNTMGGISLPTAGGGATDITVVGGENLFDPTRVDNAVAYVSPSFSGFNVTVAYSNQAIGQENLDNQGDNTVFAILPKYENGPLMVGLSYHQIDLFNDVSGLDGNKITNWAVGGSYDFGMVKVSAFYDSNKWKDFMGANGDVKLNSWMLGASIPFGKHAVQASYNTSKVKGLGGTSADADQWALGYTYALSKRTNVYAAYADISNDNSAGNTASQWSRTAQTGDSSNATLSGFQSGFQAGIKHTF